MKAHRHSRSVLAAAIATAIVGWTPTVAGAEESGFALEEILVTARKKEENLQDAPLAVSAFSAESLKAQGIANVSDFNNAVPGVEVQAGNGVAGVANIYIRGVGQRNTEPNLDSGVGIYYDGVYLSRADGALLDMNDVAQVQVLRGPQGTLFGKNTTGGALLINTNKPVYEFEGKASVTVGNYGQTDANVVVNVPLIDEKLATRIALMSIKRDGYIDNITLNEDYNDADRKNAVWQTRWQATENFLVDLNVNYAKTEQAPRGLQCHPSSVNFGSAWLASLQNGAVFPATGKTLEQHCLDSAATDKDKIVQDLGGGYNSENTGAALTMNWEFGNGLALKSISAFRNTKAGQNDDLDPLSIPFQHRTNDQHPFAQDRDTDQWTQELNLSGKSFDDSLSWIVGAYYFTEETKKSRTVGITGPFGVVRNVPAAAVGIPVPWNIDIVSYTGSATDLLTDNESWAGFAQGDWAIDDKWTVTLGLRYTKEKRELERDSWVTDPTTLSTSPFPVLTIGSNTYAIPAGTFNPLHGFIPAPAIQNPVVSANVDDDAWTPMVSLAYSLDGVGFIDTGSAYITLSKGFRSGGLSESPSANLEEFAPEEVVSTEIGIKFDGFDKRLRVNAALFDLDYDDRQLTTIVVSPQGRIAGATINAAKSSVRGFELETTFLPTENFELGANLAWYDDKISEWSDIQLGLNTSGVVPGGVNRPGLTNDVPATVSGPNCSLSVTVVENVGTVEQCAIDRSDENLPRLPSKSMVFSAQYFFNTSVGTVIPRIQYSKKFDIDSCFDRLSCTSGDFLNDHEDLSARLSWIAPNGDLSITAYGSNLTDEEFVVGGQPLYDAWGFGGYVYAPPRMYGVELAYKW